MAKKSVYRVIGIIFSKDMELVIEDITPYLNDYKRLIISPLKQEYGRKIPKYLRIQIDYSSHVNAENCRDAISDFLLEDKSNF